MSSILSLMQQLGLPKCRSARCPVTISCSPFQNCGCRHPTPCRPSSFVACLGATVQAPFHSLLSGYGYSPSQRVRWSRRTPRELIILKLHQRDGNKSLSRQSSEQQPSIAQSRNHSLYSYIQHRTTMTPQNSTQGWRSPATQAMVYSALQ